MSMVGIIANPASGKDIRRLVAYGTNFDNLEKVAIARRALLGLATTGIKQVMYMPDYYGIIPKALDGLSRRHQLPFAVAPLDMDITGLQEDSATAARLIREMGGGSIITMGGDGTNRMVSKGCGQVPLVPISTGTNNVFPEMVEGTVAGLAAGVVAQGIVAEPPGVITTKKLSILKNGQVVDEALIDAVVLKDTFIGSRAVWDEERIVEIIVTRGEAHNIGISSIPGNLDPIGIGEARGLVVEVGSGENVVFAAIAPGLLRPVKIKGFRSIEVGETIGIKQVPCIIALDGEREVEAREGDQIQVRLSIDGPRVVDVRQALNQAVRAGYSKNQTEVNSYLEYLREE